MAAEPLFHDGAPRWALGLTLIAAVPLVATPLCVVLPFYAATAVSVLGAIGAAWWLRARLPAPSPRRWTRHLACAAMALFACACLYTRTFSGLPNWIGSDAGNHAFELREFQRIGLHTYGGCVSMYAAWLLVEKILRLNAFWSFAVVFYGQIALLAALPLVVAFGVLRWFDARAWRVGAAAAIACALAGLLGVVLPLEHYFQVEGFWTVLFSLVPLLYLWWLDATLVTWWHRVLAWAIAGVVFRYTYALNLGEVVLAFGVVCVLEAPPRLKLLSLGALAASLAGVTVIVRRLLPMIPTWGWFVRYDVTHALEGGACAVAALLIAAFGNRAATKPLGLGRALRVPLLVGAGGLLFDFGFQHHFKPTYYVWKYPFDAICLLSTGGAVAVGVVAAVLVSRRGLRDRVWAAATVTLFVAALGIWFSTFAEYHRSFSERLVGMKPRQLRPLADLTAWRLIDETVAKEKKKFGGYLVMYGPESNFMNASMGVGDGQKFYFKGEAPAQGPGYCVFWDATRPPPWPEWQRWYRHRWWADRLDHDRAAQCVEYPAPWNADARQRLCHLCR